MGNEDEPKTIRTIEDEVVRPAFLLREPFTHIKKRNCLSFMRKPLDNCSYSRTSTFIEKSKIKPSSKQPQKTEFNEEMPNKFIKKQPNEMATLPSFKLKPTIAPPKIYLFRKFWQTPLKGNSSLKRSAPIEESKTSGQETFLIKQPTQHEFNERMKKFNEEKSIRSQKIVILENRLLKSASIPSGPVTNIWKDGIFQGSTPVEVVKISTQETQLQGQETKENNAPLDYSLKNATEPEDLTCNPESNAECFVISDDDDDDECVAPIADAISKDDDDDDDECVAPIADAISDDDDDDDDECVAPIADAISDDDDDDDDECVAPIADAISDDDDDDECVAPIADAISENDDDDQCIVISDDDDDDDHMPPFAGAISKDHDYVYKPSFAGAISGYHNNNHYMPPFAGAISDGNDYVYKPPFAGAIFGYYNNNHYMPPFAGFSNYMVVRTKAEASKMGRRFGSGFGKY